MANLTAVLRKTIDGLPSANPQLRAKVYEKARAAITRQIQAADPPLEDHVVEARYRVLEDAIRQTEAHYTGGGEDAPAASGEAPAAPPEAPDRRPSSVQETGGEPPRVSEPTPSLAPAKPVFPRVTPTMRPASPPAEPSAPPASEAKVGEVGPAADDDRESRATPLTSGAGLRPAASTETRDAKTPPAASGPAFSGIPEADVTGPRYTAPRAKGRRRAPIAAGIAILALAGVGTAGWLYQDDIRALLTGPTEVASVPPAASSTPTTDAGESPAPVEAGETPAVAVPPSGTPTDTAPAEAGGVQPRQFTQRLMPDGTEVDAGPGASVANAFEEGTDVATASLNTPADTPDASDPAAPIAPASTPPVASAEPAAGAPLPVGQRAVFYEERSANREGSQETGNVVWSVVNEPPADGQPPEPAIRAVADVPDEDLKMTMTIRRNADTTLPASHVIEIMFDTPPDFSGGQIENVQRLALKPTEQARGEPLIGVAGKISDGFFIIALNDLKQAVDSNLGLLGSEDWIDIPLAYASGQRALMSIEKGIPGERVFKEAMDAWAAKT